jgi:N-methylhydantoinase A
MTIDRDCAVKAVQTLADAMDIDLMVAAEGIIKIVNESMLGALRLVSVEQGYDPRDFALVAFGGAGPLHANALSMLTGAWPVIVPMGAGVLCAYGDATTQVRDEASQTYVRRVDELSAEEFVAELEALRARASVSFAEDGIPEDEQEVQYEADIRYAGQAFELSMSVTVDDVMSQGLTGLTNEFDRQHEQLFTFAHGKDHEIVMLRAVVKAQNKGMAEISVVKTGASLDDAKIHDTKFYFEGEWHDAVIFDREKLSVGAVIPGPAIVQEMDSTTLILPGHAATVDEVGNLLINPDK